MRVEGIIFDKDGTLFDFHATWAGWTKRFLTDFAEGDQAHATRLAALIGYDYGRGTFRPDSVVIAGTNEDLARALAAGLTADEAAELATAINRATSTAEMAEAVPLVPLLRGLRGRGLALGLATNDAESSARGHLATAGIDRFFDFVGGFDSGHGGKPAPGMLLAAARHMGLDPGRMAMVGDSTHDLVAGRAAGMIPVAVLTGIAGHDELAPHAEVVLPDIGHLPDWLG